MNKILFIAFMLLLIKANLFAQMAGGAFRLEGRLSGAQKDSVLLTYKDAAGKQIHAAGSIKNGLFTLSGRVDGPGSAELLFKTKEEIITEEGYRTHSRQIFLEPGIITIQGNPERLEDLTITGSKTEDDYKEYKALVHPAEQQLDLLHKRSAKETDKKIKDSVHHESELYMEKIQALTYDFFVNHPRSWYAEYLFEFYMPMFKLDAIKKVYEGLSPSLKENELGKGIAKRIEGLEAGSPGRMVQYFTTRDINGKPFSLADFKGKYVILDFWASWCMPCRRSHPHLRALYAKYKDRGLEVVGIASDEQHPDLWKTAVEKDSIGIWHHVLGGADMAKTMKGEDNPDDIGAKYGISALPTKLIIDPSGKIIARYVGAGEGTAPEEMDKKLAEIYDGGQ